jgi:hypothetical protein
MAIEDSGVREARRLADVADAAWREHTGEPGPCVQCRIASRRNRAALCAAGVRLAAERRQAAADLAAERAAAAAPNPDQAPLFDLPAIEAC